MTLRSQWREFLAGGSPDVYRILLHGMLFGMAFSISDMLFNFYLQSLGYDNAVAGQMQSVFRLAGVLFGVPIGMVIDRVGAQRMLYIGISTYALCWLLLLLIGDAPLVTPFGTISSLMLISLIYFVIGAANMTTYTAVVPLLSTIIEPQQRAAMFGINAAASTMIGFVGSIVAGLLPSWVGMVVGVDATSETAYRTALYCVSIFGLLAIIPLSGVKKASRTQPAPTAPRDDMPATAPRLSFMRLLLFAMPSVFFGIAGGMFIPFQNLYFRQEFNANDSLVGLSIALGSLAMGIGSIMGGPLSKRIGVRRATAISRFMAAPMMFLMLIPQFYVVSAAYDLNRALVGLTFPLFSALVMQSVPLQQRGTATSMSSMTWSLGWAGSAILSGYMQQNGNFEAVIIISGISYIISALLVQFIPYADKLD
ncbi:MAG: MFS transporter [Roseiflexaceae bacterium]